MLVALLPATAGAQLRGGKLAGVVANPTGFGFWIVGIDGFVTAVGTAEDIGHLPVTDVGSNPYVPVASSPDGQGLWGVMADSTVLGTGLVPDLGGIDATITPSGIGDVAATPSGHGLFVPVRRRYGRGDGRCHQFGKPASEPDRYVSTLATPSGHGYHLVAKDGAIAAFGDALVLKPFDQSEGSCGIDAALTTSGRGMTMLYDDGSVRVTGDATFYGDAVDQVLTPRGLVALTNGRGYRIVDHEGRVLSFGQPNPGPVGGSIIGQP